MNAWDGFYAGYMSGSEGPGFAMFVFSKGVIVGADPLGVLFDGSYTVLADDSVTGVVTVSVPSGGTVIQGASAGPGGLSYEVPISFPSNALDLDYLALKTPLGPVNLRMKKLRGIGSE